MGQRLAARAVRTAGRRWSSRKAYSTDNPLDPDGAGEPAQHRNVNEAGAVAVRNILAAMYSPEHSSLVTVPFLANGDSIKSNAAASSGAGESTQGPRLQ